MFKLFTAFFVATIILFCTVPTTFAEDASSKPPQIQGEGAYLIDVLTGQTLFSKNPDKPLAPASTTKIMTGLIAIEHGHLDDIVTASSTMLNNKVVYGTQIYLEPGESMPLKNLLYALLLNSANDAAVAIAEHVGGDLPTFVKMMNQRAAEIGASQTHFLNSSGLTEAGHVTTAHDLALIARVAYKNPIFAEYVSTKSMNITRAKPNVPTQMLNENKLLWRDSAVDGIKTGYTAAAQNCLVASVTKDGRQFIGVILKSPGREIYPDMQAMFEFGFTQFEDTVYKASGSVISTIIVNGEPVNLTLDRSIYMTQKRGEQSSGLDLQVIHDLPSPLGSVQQGQVVAHVEVREGDTLINTVPLLAARTINPPISKDSTYSKYYSWRTMFIVMGVVLFFLTSQKLYSDWHWRRQMRLYKRRESNP